MTLVAPINYRNDLTLDEKVLMAIVRAAENFKRTHSAVFKPFGLSFPQYNILRVLESSHMGQNKISVVGKIMLVPGANMTGLAKRLEQKGFITRQPDPDDERVTLLTITEKGRLTLSQIKKEKDFAITAILRNFDSAEKTGLLEKIKQIITATSEMNQHPEKHRLP
jgi:DNA-binding MarR family transcriptional regulator